MQLANVITTTSNVQLEVVQLLLLLRPLQNQILVVDATNYKQKETYLNLTYFGTEVKHATIIYIAISNYCVLFPLLIINQSILANSKNKPYILPHL